MQFPSRNKFELWCFLLCALFCLSNFVDPPLALLLGVILSRFIANPLGSYARPVSQKLLQGSVVGLGFGMNLFEAVRVSKEGFMLTICSITFTIVFGLVMGKLLSVNQKTSWLISFGTAICGGSAVAAISPIVEADEQETSAAIGTIFLLNAIALFLFPLIGKFLEMNSTQFGMWAAVAIHDTSSVIGAAQKYGADALQIATTVKLGRALWILPGSLVVAAVYNRKSWNVNFPFFILLFVAATVMHTFIPQLNNLFLNFALIARKGLTLALFLIGMGLTTIEWKFAKPLMLGIILWILISIGSLYAIL